MCLRQEDFIENEVRDIRRSQIMQGFEVVVRDLGILGGFLQCDDYDVLKGEGLAVGVFVLRREIVCFKFWKSYLGFCVENVDVGNGWKQGDQLRYY